MLELYFHICGNVMKISLNLGVNISVLRFARCSKSACPERAKELKGFGVAAAPPQRFARGAPAVVAVVR